MKRLVLRGLSIACAVLVAAPLSAQVYTGRIDVTIKDSTGAVLPGVTVEATGTQTASTVTDSQGEARFVNLAPGRYAVTAKLSGFADYKNDNVPVNAGSIVPLEVTMGVGGVAEKVDVTSDTPVIETKKQTVSTNVNLDELQNLPSSRDPWVVLQTVPGIIVDRVNVGGAESGQQSNYQAKGAVVGDNTWNMDGIAITDMAALGASPTYYDFDMFQEMQVTTGGADPANASPGVQLNFVLRSGTSRWRGSSRFYFEDNGLQSDNVSDDLFGVINGYNRIAQYKDYGIEGGGPLVRNRLFAWGAYGKTEPELQVFSFDGGVNDYVQIARDATFLENYSSKITAEINPKTRALFAYFRGNKEKFGRGASVQRPDETTQNQTGPTDLFKFEGSRTIGDNIFVTGRYAYTKNRFDLIPRGGLDAQVLSRRLERRPRILLLGDDEPSAAQRVGRRQHVQGTPRFEVRLRLAQIERHVGERLARQRRPHAPRRIPEHDGPRRPRLRRGGRGHLLARVRRRHDQPEPADHQRRRPLGPFRQLRSRSLGAGEPRAAGSDARAERAGGEGRDRVELADTARGLHLRPERVEAHDSARKLRDVCVAARLEPRRHHRVADPVLLCTSTTRPSTSTAIESPISTSSRPWTGWLASIPRIQREAIRIGSATSARR